jgi:uncharacterized membrane protein
MPAIFSLPSPLHPALVHFPIVLILLGSVVAVAAAFIRRWHLPVIAAALFVLGALGTVIAVQTGEREGELVGETPAIEQILDQHEKWAERTQLAAIIVALLAVAAAVTSRWPRAARTLGGVAAAGALAATWCVAETGHYGGQLVYRHGAGVNLASAGSTSALAGPADVAKGKKPRKDIDD